MRIAFTGAAGQPEPTLDALSAGFQPIADRFGMNWTLRDRGTRKRVMFLVSKLDHCLTDLLFRILIFSITSWDASMAIVPCQPEKMILMRTSTSSPTTLTWATSLNHLIQEVSIT
jgi:hypothetical protein